MTVQRMDNVGIVVEDLHAAIECFTELARFDAGGGARRFLAAIGLSGHQFEVGATDLSCTCDNSTFIALETPYGISQ